MCGGHSASVGTLLLHTKGKSAGWLTIVSSPANVSCPSWARAAGRAPKKTPTVIHRGHCPSWARTRTLLIQRGRCNPPNSGNLQPFTRVRVTRCRSLKGFMPDFAVLYSLKCRSLLDFRVVGPVDPCRSHATVERFDRIDVLVNYASSHEALPLQVYLDSPPRLAHTARNGARNFSRPATENTAVLFDDPAPSVYSIVARW